jgi:hypothetical protein
MLGSFTSYLVATRIHGHTGFSVSITFFNWLGWKRIFFILSLLGISIPLLVMEAYSVDHSSLPVMNQIGHYGLIASAGMVFGIGVYADFRRSKFAEIMHVSNSFGAILVGLTSFVFVGWPKWYISLIPLLAFLITAVIFRIVKIRNLTRWDEILAYILVIAATLYYFVAGV